MIYMLDTNMCIHIMKHTQNVLDNFAEKNNDNMCISSITLAELEYGVCKSTVYEKNREKLLTFLPLIEILPFNDLAAVEYGMIRSDLQKKGTPIGPLDMLIAAHAKSKGFTLVTNNTNEFNRVDDLQIEDWLVA